MNTKFSFDVFKEKPHYLNRNKYLEQTLGEPIGQGSSRRTYEIPNKGLVIKTAFPTKIEEREVYGDNGKLYHLPHIVGGKLGYLQNKEEYRTSIKCLAFKKMGLLTNIVLSADDFEWLVSEAVEPLTFGENDENKNENAFKKFKNCAGIDFYEFGKLLIRTYEFVVDELELVKYNSYFLRSLTNNLLTKDNNQDPCEQPKINYKDKSLVINNEEQLLKAMLKKAEGNMFVVKVVLGAIKCGLNIYDLATPTSWGISKADGKPKLLDFGYTKASERIYRSLPYAKYPKNDTEVKNIFRNIYIKYIFPYYKLYLDTNNIEAKRQHITLFSELENLWLKNNFYRNDFKKMIENILNKFNVDLFTFYGSLIN